MRETLTTRQPNPYFLCVLAMVCLLSQPAAMAARPGAVASAQREILTLPIAAFILVADDGERRLSSRRSVDSMAAHFAQVNRIWSQAGIELDPVEVQRVAVPGALLRGLIERRGRGGIADLFSAIRRGEIEFGRTADKALIWAFYVSGLGGPNGLKPLGANAIFVVDAPSNDGYRVTSHEIGHILGLYHARNNPDQLLFSGTNGTVLTEEEQIVARYSARRLLRR